MILNLREAYYRPFRAADSEWGSSYWRAAEQELDRINHDAQVDHDAANSIGSRSERDQEEAGGDFEMTRKVEREREEVFPFSLNTLRPYSHSQTRRVQWPFSEKTFVVTVEVLSIREFALPRWLDVQQQCKYSLTG
jgi:hypothetical protein